MDGINVRGCFWIFLSHCLPVIACCVDSSLNHEVFEPEFCASGVSVCFCACLFASGPSQHCFTVIAYEV